MQINLKAKLLETQPVDFTTQDGKNIKGFNYTLQFTNDIIKFFNKNDYSSLTGKEVDVLFQVSRYGNKLILADLAQE